MISHFLFIISGDNIPQVEELIRKHRDFEEAIKVQEEKFTSLKRSTMIEEAFAQQKADEARARKAEKERLEQERLEQRKRMEVARIAEMRRQASQENEIKTKKEEIVNGETVLPQTQDTVITNPPQNGNGTSIRKTNSFAHMFERDRIRRDSAGAAVKRAESMKVGPISKPPKRTPSFNTKKRGSAPRITGKEIFVTKNYILTVMYALTFFIYYQNHYMKVIHVSISKVFLIVSYFF